MSHLVNLVYNWRLQSTQVSIDEQLRLAVAPHKQ